MRPLLERLGGFLPAAIALALPTVFIPIAVDSYILPRAAIVIAGAGLGCGLALLPPGGPSLGPACACRCSPPPPPRCSRLPSRSPGR